MADKKSLRNNTRVDYNKLHIEGHTTAANSHTTPADNEEELDESIASLNASIQELDRRGEALKLQIELQSKEQEIKRLQAALASAQDQPPSPQQPSSPQHPAAPHHLAAPHQPAHSMPPQSLHSFAQSGLQLDTLLSKGLQPELREQKAHEMRADLDPHVYLRKPGIVKYRPIVNYIPRAINCDDEEIDLGNGVAVKLKTNPKPKIETVTPAQWTVANARILAELLEETPAHSVKTTTLDYLSHTAKMGELATRYTWSSVILLDDEYRRLQAHYGFRWGSDTPHVSTLLLREREIERAKPKKSHAAPKFSAEAQPVCHIFNSGKTCHYGNDCRFRHVCATCGGAHARVNHSAETSKKHE